MSCKMKEKIKLEFPIKLEEPNFVSNEIKYLTKIKRKIKEVIRRSSCVFCCTNS